MLALAPLGKKGDVSFILDKKKVENAHERMRVEEARYTGIDDKGQRFLIVCEQRHPAQAPTCRSSTSTACSPSSTSRLRRCSSAQNKGRYNLDTQKILIDGPVRVTGGDGYRLATCDVTVDLKQRQMQSAGPGRGFHAARPVPGGPASAPTLASRTVVLDGGARLKIVQGAVR